MTRKYHSASSATAPIIVGTLSVPALHLNAKNVINENARKSRSLARSIEMNTARSEP